MPDEPPSPESRLVELETRYAFLEEQLEALDRAVLEQGREIDGLRAELARLRAEARRAPDAGDAADG